MMGQGEARTPYGRRTDRKPGEVLQADQPAAGGHGRRAYGGATYYTQPPIKKSHWQWLIVTYFFIGGLAGAAQIIATVADLLGGERDRSVVRGGRYLALLGALSSPILLIADLHTPSRWYNMLRIYRQTSPMNFGAWTLTVFGAFSGLAALGQLLDDLTGTTAGRWLSRGAGLPASLAGALMAVYTGTLLTATSTPLWATAYRLLPALFGASAAATANAALSLVVELSGAPKGVQRRLTWLSFLSSAAQLILALAAERQWQRAGVATPIEQQPRLVAYRWSALGLGMAAPLVIHAVHALTGRQATAAASAAALATLIGGYAERALLIFGGRESAAQPDDYFRITRPTAMPSGGRTADDLNPASQVGGAD